MSSRCYKDEQEIIFYINLVSKISFKLRCFISTRNESRIILWYQTEEDLNYTIFTIIVNQKNAGWTLTQKRLFCRYSGAACGLAFVFIYPSLIYMISLYQEERLTWPKFIFHVFIIILGLANLVVQFFMWNTQLSSQDLSWYLEFWQQFHINSLVNAVVAVILNVFLR